MKKIFLLGFMGLMMLGILSCNTSTAKSKTCHIKGSVGTKWNGKKIFLVPLQGLQDAAHVDSTVIKDGAFLFDKDTCGLYVIRMDYHYREGIQELLVVTEPGQVNVHIAQNSTANGTEQNDSLQVWKDYTISANQKYSQLRMKYEHAGDSDGRERAGMEAQAKEIQKQYKQRTRAMADALKPGVLKDYLSSISK